MVATVAPSPEDVALPRRHHTLRWGALLAGVALLAAFGAGYQFSSKSHGIHWHTGSGYSGERVVTVNVDGWSYGFADSIAWIDDQRSYHEGGWPDCLPATSSVSVRFASVDNVPDSVGFRPVVMVDCSGR